MTDRRGASGGLRGDLKQRVKTGRGRTASQKRWLERQLNDPYVARAKREGYRSRAAFKLTEIDERFKLLRPGQRVVDLGAAPGGWSQVAAKVVGPSGRVVGIDLLEIEPMAGVEFVTLDFLDPEAPGILTGLLGGLADLILSDMAANTTGHKQTDHLRIIGLAETAAAFAREILAPGGAYLAKVFQGGTEGTLLAELKRDFEVVRHVKPNASRADSSELYVLATGFRGQAGGGA
ncbi:RlmE family RNA methyltransferase [Methylobacterium iners]|uniref:Ribosomal RNA large subunit methyltransferase E n=1 Tax=Methylobacterium iners TaxID=418707 RepID=A0ABQ4RWB6_9HYPH|nr:RlmE family RNA methyltransferase [Methylobacterium iners]GJD94876.1 Ribosomal RNA large subunit methyltransferase E [Methylobacterium iners]